MSAVSLTSAKGLAGRRADLQTIDLWLVLVVLALLSIGLVMVASASMSIAERDFGNPFYYFNKQLIFALLGIALACVMMQIPMGVWESAGILLLLLALVMLVVVLIPGVGKTVNGSTRWLAFGPARLQVSEFARLFLLIYLAGYLVRRGPEVRERIRGFLKPLIVLCLAAFLLVMEPDFGAAVMLMAAAMVMMFVGGVSFWQFLLLFSGLTFTAVVLAITSPYRLQRITGFMDPWADPFGSGFQLTQSLIAIGSGSWGGLGLGSSVQKLFYLPEAHTDFLFAILAEELGLIGVLVVIGLYVFLLIRAWRIARKASESGMMFSAYLATGIMAWVGMQAFINMGISMGLLPTKGLTLPLLSAGGSSTLAVCIALGMLLRIGHEAEVAQVQASRGQGRGQSSVNQSKNRKAKGAKNTRVGKNA